MVKHECDRSHVLDTFCFFLVFYFNLRPLGFLDCVYCIWCALLDQSFETRQHGEVFIFVCFCGCKKSLMYRSSCQAQGPETVDRQRPIFVFSQRILPPGVGSHLFSLRSAQNPTEPEPVGLFSRFTGRKVSNTETPAASTSTIDPKPTDIRF